MLLDVLCSNRGSFNVFIVFAKIIFSFLILLVWEIKLLISCQSVSDLLIRTIYNKVLPIEARLKHMLQEPSLL